MSYHTWTVEGYGVPLDKFNPNLQGLANVLELAPKAKAEMLPIIEMHLEAKGFSSIEEADKEEPFDCHSYDVFEDSLSDIGCVLPTVLTELLGVTISAIAGFEEEYLLYIPRYPWNMDDTEKALSNKLLCDTFVKVLKAADETVSEEDVRNLIDDQSVNNGG